MIVPVVTQDAVTVALGISAPVSASMLRSLENEFASQVADLLLFTESLNEIVVVRLDGTVERGSRVAHQLSPRVDRVDIVQAVFRAMVSRLRQLADVVQSSI